MLRESHKVLKHLMRQEALLKDELTEARRSTSAPIAQRRLSQNGKTRNRRGARPAVTAIAAVPPLLACLAFAAALPARRRPVLTLGLAIRGARRLHHQGVRRRRRRGAHPARARAADHPQVLARRHGRVDEIAYYEQSWWHRTAISPADSAAAAGPSVVSTARAALRAGLEDGLAASRRSPPHRRAAMISGAWSRADPTQTFALVPDAARLGRHGGSRARMACSIVRIGGVPTRKRTAATERRGIIDEESMRDIFVIVNVVHRTQHLRLTDR